MQMSGNMMHNYKWEWRQWSAHVSVGKMEKKLMLLWGILFFYMLGLSPCEDIIKDYMWKYVEISRRDVGTFSDCQSEQWLKG